MQFTGLEAAVIFGIVIPQISSISISSTPSDCLADVDTCMSNLCESEQALHSGICKNEGCQIKGSEVCNMTIQTILDQFPSLQGCVCAWEGEELCDSIQALATQCQRKPASHQKRSTVKNWKSSTLLGYVYDGAGSCFDQMGVCVSDAVCNRHLALVLHACKADMCNPEHCQQVTQHFYSSMPQNVAEMLVMCDCEASDQFCIHIKNTLHSGTCGDKTWICQDTVSQCTGDSNCRDLLKTFQAKCWSSAEAVCSDLQSDECFSSMDPTLILGADSECKMAFLATLGTVLHQPCSCEGVRNNDLKSCNMIRNIFHNRSHFMTTWKSSSGPTTPPEINGSDHGRTSSQDYLLYAFATVLLVGVVLLMPLAIVSKIWMLRKQDKTKYHHPQKSNCVFL